MQEIRHHQNTETFPSDQDPFVALDQTFEGVPLPTSEMKECEEEVITHDTFSLDTSDLFSLKPKERRGSLDDWEQELP